MQAKSGVQLSVLGSWSLPKEGQEGMESFLRDLSTIFPQERWLQIRRHMGKMGFTCEILNQDQSKMLSLIVTNNHHQLQERNVYQMPTLLYRKIRKG